MDEKDETIKQQNALILNQETKLEESKSELKAIEYINNDYNIMLEYAIKNPNIQRDLKKLGVLLPEPVQIDASIVSQNAKNVVMYMQK